MTAESKQVKVYTKAEVEKHKSRDDLWLVIEHKHPGGEEVLLEYAGIDATEAFRDIGHSDDAVQLLKDYYVGDLEGADKLSSSPRDMDGEKSSTGGGATATQSGSKATESASPLNWAIPVALGVAFLAYKYYGA
ncbi:Cytochrome b5 [Mycoemilia scoparia]|uniref:Cytochrome b5 n=1 Tax=Mycoemilia scoparia TaxID=417184 RepID=A0A9W7ZJ44_9FUNG|nr:Cytochrome b5 [Mycoemilia scoparia]